MRKFVFQLTFFFLPMVVLAYAADIFLSRNLKKTKTEALGEIETWNNIYSGNINADVVIYGSSRAWEHIDPQMIKDSLGLSAYNLGCDASHFPIQYFRHCQLLKYNTKPKTIIYSLDIFAFIKEDGIVHYDQFFPFMLNNREVDHLLKTFYTGYRIFDCKLPLLRYAGQRDIILHAFHLFFDTNFDQVKRKNGYQAQEIKWTDDFEKAKEEVPTFTVKMDPKLVQLFDTYLEECKGYGIKIVFVYSPELIDGQKFVNNRAEVIEKFKEFSLKYAIPFYDYSNDTMSFRRDYFFNTLHLNKVGSQVFTTKLIGDLKRDSVLVGTVLGK